MQGYLWCYYVTPRAVTDGQYVARWERECSVGLCADSRHQLHSFKKLLRGRLWMQRQDSQQVFLSIVCQTWWVTAPPLTTSSAPHKQLLFDRTPSRQMVLREPVSLLNPRTQPHANTHMLVSKHTDASTPEHRRILLPSSWRRARLWDTCSLSGV